MSIIRTGGSIDLAQETIYSTAPWNPGKLKDVIYRGRSDFFTITSGTFTWDDLSCNGNAPSQATSAQQPVIVASGANGYRLRCGASTYSRLDFPTNALSALTEGEVFIIFQRIADPPNDQQGGLWNLGTSSDSTYVPYSDGNVYDCFGSSVRHNAAGVTSGKISSICIYNVSSAASAWTNRLNGTQLSTTGTNAVQFDAAQWLFCGGSSPAAAYLNGYVDEIVMCASVQSAYNRAKMLAYSVARYSIA